MNKSVINETLELLSENSEWKERYERYIAYVSEKQPKRFRKPAGLSVYSSVSAYKGQTYDLRFEGQSVGLVSCSKEGVRLHPKNKNNNKYVELNFDEETYDWHSKEATTFRKHFKELAGHSKDVKLKSPEHTVENKLLKEFAKRTRAKGKSLCNIQPITLYGCFFQMPTPIKASDHKAGPGYAKQYGGGIDILARTGGRICVMEVKDENKKNESQSDAMEQALCYATFMASLLRSESGQQWWDFLMGREKGTTHQVPETLNIDVVTVMPKDHTEEYSDEIIDLPQLSARFHCHSLYFDDKEYENDRFVFSGTYPKYLKQ